MPLKLIQKEIEAEREIGYRYLQVLSRAEALVPGAGREAIELLLDRMKNFKNKRTRSVKRIILSAELVLRGSEKKL